MRKPKVEMFTGKNDQFYFRVKSANGKVVAQSEGYTTTVMCRAGVRALARCFPTGWVGVSVIDLTKKG